MWYTDTDKQELDFTKPICATSCDGRSTYLLLPTNQDKSYNFVGIIGSTSKPVSGTVAKIGKL